MFQPLHLPLSPPLQHKPVIKVSRLREVSFNTSRAVHLLALGPRASKGVAQLSYYSQISVMTTEYRVKVACAILVEFIKNR